jgi:hypothetical protein
VVNRPRSHECTNATDGCLSQKYGQGGNSAIVVPIRFDHATIREDILGTISTDGDVTFLIVMVVKHDGIAKPRVEVGLERTRTYRRFPRDWQSLPSRRALKDWTAACYDTRLGCFEGCFEKTGDAGGRSDQPCTENDGQCSQ